MTLIHQTWESPLGKLHLVAGNEGLVALAFQDNWKTIRRTLGPTLHGTHPVLERTIRELDEYFAGKRREFSVPLAVQGTPFQRKAWAALRAIPFGETSTYARQATRIRKPTAVRAVGRANGLNPVCIIVPCHRVVGSNGSLTGYAGGLKAKKALLALEGAKLP